MRACALLLAHYTACAAAAADLPQSPPPPAPWDAVLHLHSNATRDAFNARCLDGTNGGFWFRPAQSPGAATKWKIHFQGVRAKRTRRVVSPPPSPPQPPLFPPPPRLPGRLVHDPRHLRGSR